MKHLLSTFLGTLLIFFPYSFPLSRQLGLAPLGPILAISIIVFSLFGKLPKPFHRVQPLAAKLFPGVAIGTILLLIPLITSQHSSLYAWSPTVWLAYISIVLVGISFEESGFPRRIYYIFHKSQLPPWVAIPTYVFIFGLLGNILDGVSIMIISVVILHQLLPLKWSIKSSFALLFGGLIGNIITVAAEPTNIVFQEKLHTVLSHTFWLENAPISIFGILFPTLWLAILLKKQKANWKKHPRISSKELPKENLPGLLLESSAITLLATGIIVHAVYHSLPLWILLLPAGIMAAVHMLSTKKHPYAIKHLKEQSPVWIKLMLIFSLLWFLEYGLHGTPNIFSGFLSLPDPVKLTGLLILSLCSALTDNVAIAAMQGSILSHDMLPLWQVRLTLITLTLAGGFTSFGCLQSLAVQHRLKLSFTSWLKQCPLWAGLAFTGGILGLLLVTILTY